MAQFKPTMAHLSAEAYSLQERPPIKYRSAGYSRDHLVVRGVGGKGARGRRDVT